MTLSLLCELQKVASSWSTCCNVLYASWFITHSTHKSTSYLPVGDGGFKDVSWPCECQALTCQTWVSCRAEPNEDGVVRFIAGKAGLELQLFPNISTILTLHSFHTTLFHSSFLYCWKKEHPVCR